MGVETVKSRVGTIDIRVDRIERELETANLAIKDVDISLGKKCSTTNNNACKGLR